MFSLKFKVQFDSELKVRAFRRRPDRLAIAFQCCLKTFGIEFIIDVSTKHYEIVTDMGFTEQATMFTDTHILLFFIYESEPLIMKFKTNLVTADNLLSR